VMPITQLQPDGRIPPVAGLNQATDQ